MNKHSQTEQLANHTRRWKDHLYEHVPLTRARAHTHTHTHTHKTCKGGRSVDVYTLLQAVVRELSLPDTSMYYSVGPISSHRKFRPPSPTFKICPSPFPFILVPQPNFLFQARKAIPCLDYGLLLLQNYQRSVLPLFLLHSTPP